MAAERFTGDTCFFSELCQNRRILSSLKFPFSCVFHIQPEKLGDEGIRGDRHKHIMQ